MDPWLIQLIGIQFAFVAFIIWIATRRSGEQERQRSEERLRLIERFETKDDLEAFLASSAGRHLVDRTGQKPSDPRRTILGSLTVGIITFFVGVSMVYLNSPPHNEDAMLIPGFILTAAGIGILIAVAVSMVLVRRWGLDNGKSARGED